MLAPIIIALMWAQHQARRYERIYRHTEDRLVNWLGDITYTDEQVMEDRV